MDHPEVAADLGGVVGLEEILSGSDPVSSSTTVQMSGNGRANSKSPLPPGKDVSIVEKVHQKLYLDVLFVHSRITAVHGCRNPMVFQLLFIHSKITVFVFSLWMAEFMTIKVE